MTTESAALLSARLIAFGALVDAGEIVFMRREYGAAGIYAWSLMRTQRRWSTAGPLARILQPLFSQRGFTTLMAAQLALALGVLVQGQGPLIPAEVACLFLLRAATNARHPFGLDGGDQMATIVLASLTLWWFAPTPFARRCALWFIAFQGTTSYFVAGAAKAVSRVWRSGTAVRAILSTRSYGSQWMASVCLGAPRLGALACRAVIVFECSFPLCLVSPKIALLLFGAGAIFHLSVAASMGLNNFLSPFLATYPVIYVTSIECQRWLHGA
jgi:hypothetical protein